LSSIDASRALRSLRRLAARRLPLVLLGAAVLAVPLVAGLRAALRAPAAEESAATTDSDTVTLAPGARATAGISVEPARTLMRAERLEAPAVLALDERRTARLGSLVEGVVVESEVQVGDRVAPGAALAQLHSHVVHDLWAEYRKAVAERRQAETELAFAGQGEERARRLYADDAISLRELQRAETDRSAAEEHLDIARTEVRRAEEALQHLGITNQDDPSGESGEYVPVRSPIGGVVLEKQVTQGSAVTPGERLFVVSDLSSLWAIAEVDETRLSLVRAGEPATVRVSAYPGEAFEGTVSFVGDVVNPRTRRITVRCQLPNPDGRLKPEMFAAVSLGTSEPAPVLVVPQAAIQEIQGRPLVFVLTPEGSFVRRDVQTGSEADGLVEVRAGLAEGEQVATSGSFLLKSQLLAGTLAAED
jgi:cobalt-zinc-cadmium efflux system membrane fusion protein